VAQPPVQTEKSPTATTAGEGARALTDAQAARAVKVRAEEVLAFAVRGDEVTVVTVDGKKIKAAL
jgi:DNA-binding LytR/AlgR family response regulator